MLLHSRSGDSKKELVDVNKLCAEIAGLAYHGARVKMPSLNCIVKTEYAEQLPELNINRQDVGRVLLNIISNGFYAMNKRKELIADKNYQPELFVSTALKNDFIEITVKDNGTGVPKSVLDKIFEPFFTTKPAGEGTGLGLSLSFDIITKGHNGRLTADSKEGEYTLFSILLPLKA
jgi:signal transduction histidine kinase